jgi:short-subunit dehydrogenase
MISVVGLASMPSIGGYSASKAALFSATQAMRADLKAKNISVHGIFPGPIDTDMARTFDMKKTSAKITAENIIKGITSNQEDIFPDPVSIEVGQVWRTNPKALEHRM